MIGAGKDSKNRLRGGELRKYGESKLWDKCTRCVKIESCCDNCFGRLEKQEEKVK